VTLSGSISNVSGSANNITLINKQQRCDSDHALGRFDQQRGTITKHGYGNDHQPDQRAIGSSAETLPKWHRCPDDLRCHHLGRRPDLFQQFDGLFTLGAITGTATSGNTQTHYLLHIGGRRHYGFERDR